MKSLRRDCGLSLKVMSGIVCVIDVLFSLLVVALVIVSWTMDQYHPTIFIYEAEQNDTYIIRQRSLEGCIISWSLCILLFLALWRMVSAVILLIGIKKDSSHISQYWIVFKILALLLSMFVTVVSFTSPTVKPSAVVSLFIDSFTSYFILLLQTEIQRMEKGVPVSKK